MTADYATRQVIALKVHCPVDRDTVGLLARGDFAAIDPNCALARMLAIVREGGPLGDFGAYRSVIELATGWELFTPGADARPTLGSAGTPTASPTAILTLHIPADAAEETISSAISAIVAAHPWEVPVIEMARTALVTRV